PMWSAYDHAKRIYFADHPLGNSILGTPESIQALKRDQMYEYFRRRYVAANIIVVAAGSYTWSELLKLIEAQCGAWAKGQGGRQGLRETAGSGAFHLLTKDKVVQEHVILIAPGPAAAAPLRYAAETVALALGDDSGSRLYWALVDPGLADAADASFHEYQG